MNFITVEQAESIIQSCIKDYGSEEVHFRSSLGKVLAEDLFADRDLPPFNRATVDGIAIPFLSFDRGIRRFRIVATQPAGGHPLGIQREDECIEIMTGAALHATTDSVIRYEDITIKEGTAEINISNMKKGQNIHPQGKDRKEGEKVAESQQLITPAAIGLAASIGKTRILVRKLPRAIIITTGDEMVSADEAPRPYQLRRSNDRTIEAVLEKYTLSPDTIHLEDNDDLIKKELTRCLEKYDVILMSGGVSMGKFDYVHKALEKLVVEKLFHRVKQRPGKPFWFGKHLNGTLIFAFPGNPVSAFMCLHRYFLPWLDASLGIARPKKYAVLDKHIQFPHPLQYFAQVRLRMNDHGQLFAEPEEGHGSGDFLNLVHTHAFMELPLEKNEFKKGEAYRIWPYNF